jgi:hypothetical protein
VSWHYSFEALAVAPALSTRNRLSECWTSFSLLQVRTLPSRVMTSNRARHELIRLPTIFKVRPLLGTRRQSGTVPGDRPRFGRGRGRSPVPVPDLSGIGDSDSPPPPSPIWRGRGRSPVPDSHRGVCALPGAPTDSELALPPAAGPRPLPEQWQCSGSGLFRSRDATAMAIARHPTSCHTRTTATGAGPPGWRRGRPGQWWSRTCLGFYPP